MILAYAALLLSIAKPAFPLGGPGDFTSFYTAAHIIRSENTHRLYDLDLQMQIQQAFTLPHGFTFENGLLPYLNPQFFALLFVPLSVLPLPWAFYTWTLVNLMLLLASVKLMRDHYNKPSLRSFSKAILVVFAFFPVFEGLYKGQSSLLILFVLAITYLAIKREQDYAAGTALALGLIKPQLVVLIAGLMLYRRRWRVIFAFGLTSIALFTISLMMVGIDGLWSYLSLMRQLLNWDGIYAYPEHMFNLRGSVYRFAHVYETWPGIPRSSTIVSSILIVASLAILALVLYRWKASTYQMTGGLELTFAQTIAAGLLLSPHLYNYDASLLVLIGLILTDHVGQRTTGATNKMVAVGHIAPALSFGITGIAGEAQVLTLLLILLVIILPGLIVGPHDVQVTGTAYT